MARKENFFAVRMNDEEYRLLTDLSREFDQNRSQTILSLLRLSSRIPDLPDYYVERLERISSAKSNWTVSKLITDAVREKWGGF